MKNAKPRFEEILNTVGPQIVNNELAVGEAITLAQIEQQFSCSRTVAREVQRSLEECGLVAAQRRRGLVVLAHSEWDVFNPRVIHWRLSGPYSERQMRSLIDLRQAIEPVATALAAQFATRDQRVEILRTGIRLVELGAHSSGPDFMAADIKFHNLILEASGNEMFVALSSAIEAVLRWRTNASLMPPRPEPRAMRDHEFVAKAIYSGEAQAAGDTMRDIVEEIREAFENHAPNILRTE